MNKIIITFDDTEIEKCKFQYSKYPINIKKVNVDKTIIFNKVSFGKKAFKHFIDYKDYETVKPLCLMLPKMSGYTMLN